MVSSNLDLECHIQFPKISFAQQSDLLRVKSRRLDEEFSRLNVFENIFRVDGIIKSFVKPGAVLMFLGLELGTHEMERAICKYYNMYPMMSGQNNIQYFYPKYLILRENKIVHGFGVMTKELRENVSILEKHFNYHFDNLTRA